MQRKPIADVPDSTRSAGGVNRLYRVLSRVNQAIVRIREPQELYEEACRIAVEDGRFLLAWIGFAEPGSDYIHPVANFGHEDGYLDSVSLSLSADVPEGQGPTGIALREGRAFINNDTANNPIMRPWRDEQLKRGFRSSASFPLKIERETVGVITLYSGVADFFDEEEIGLLTTLADDFSFALESAEKREASRRLERATFLLEAAEQVNKSVRLEVLLERLADIALRATAHSRAFVGLLAEDRSQLTFAPTLGMEALAPGTIVPWDGLSLPLREALTSGETRVVEYSHVPVGLRGIADTVHSRTALLVPIVFDAEVLGHIALDDPGESKAFTEGDIEIVQSIAAQAAVAMQNARLFEDQHTRAGRASVLKELAEIGVTAANVNDAAERQAQAIVRLLGASHAAVVMSDGERLQPVALVGYPDDYVEKLTPLPEDALAAQAFRSGRPRFVADLHTADTSEFTREVSTALGFGSFAALPLGPSGALIGAVGFVWHETRPFDRDEVTFLEAVASELAVGLSNQRAQDTLRESEEQFHSLAESISNLAWWANADGYITWYNRRWYDYTGTTPEQMEGWGWQSVHDPEMLPAVLERWTASIASGAPFDMEFPLRGADGVFRTFLTRAEPLRDSSGRVIRWFGTNTDISTIKATEGRLRALVDTEKESARLSEALNDANAAVHSSLDIDQVMQDALETGVKALGCDAGAVEMLDGDEWVVRYQSGFTPSDVGMRLSNAQAPIAASALLQAGPLAIADLRADKERNVGFVKQYDLKSVLAVPLNAKSQTIGCALFYAAESIKRFTEGEVDFGRKLASAVSLALENARLYDTERNIANVLQSALLTLPASLPGFEFANAYSSATETTNVGGDFYDIFELDEHYVGITIGDVSGKGLDAAVLTSLIRNSIRAYASEDDVGPSRVLTQANQIVYRSTPKEVFATVFFAMVDRRDGRLLYANAGHPAAAVVMADGTSARMSATGPLLGAFPGTRFDEREVCLDPGDVLFLYTDGLTEARRGGELYGEDRLFAFLPTMCSADPTDVIEAVLAEVKSYAGDRLRDDLAVLAVKRVVS